MIELTADRLVLVDGGRATEYNGSMEDYIAMVLSGDGAAGGGGAKTKGNKKEDRKAAAEAREKEQAAKRRAQQAEAELVKLTAKRSAVDKAMFDPAGAELWLTKMSMSELMKRRAELDAQVEAAEAAWLEASEALEEAA
jgi:ATP-binding cassette subfamily F protein 3